MFILPGTHDEFTNVLKGFLISPFVTRPLIVVGILSPALG